jgi:3-phenylpropionate/cinnamic acid dioxygenase small subunit
MATILIIEDDGDLRKFLIRLLERENYYYYMPYRNSITGKLAPVASPYYDEKVILEQRIASIKSEIKALQEKVSNILKSLQ